MIKVEKTRLSCTDVGACGVLPIILEGLVDDTYYWAASDSDTDHIRHIIKVPISEGV